MWWLVTVQDMSVGAESCRCGGGFRTMMKTKAGRAMAAGRHAFMEQFLKQLQLEVLGQR